MKYAGIIKNDLAAGPGVCVSFFTQGCPHHCPGCHNPETWDFDGGKEFTPIVIEEIDKALDANGVHRDFCLLGGEPLCDENLFLSYLILEHVKIIHPDVKTYIWSGYTYEQLMRRAATSTSLRRVLELTDILIDGPFIQEQRDITLHMRGSRNQRIWDLKTKKELKELE